MKVQSTGQRAFQLIRFRPGITRHQIAELLNVSVTTINPVIARLLDDKTIEEVASRSTSARIGRPRNGLQLAGKRESIGVMLWSHGVLEVSIATFDNEIVFRERTKVATHPSTDDILAAARSLNDYELDPTVSKMTQLVFGIPAPYERGVGLPQGLLGSALTPADNAYAQWFPRDPRTLLANELKIPVIVENDANLGALGESTLGAGQSDGSLIYVKLSNFGIGSGITVDRHLVKGSHGFAGEIAHLRVDDDSTTICACGSKGCLELKLGPNLLRQLHPTYGESITYDDLLLLAAQGAPGPVRTLRDAGRLIGRPLADLSTFLNPSSIVIDAGSNEASEIVRLGLADEMEQSSPPFIRNQLSIRISKLRDDAAFMGAVEIVRDYNLKRARKSPKREQAIAS